MTCCDHCVDSQSLFNRRTAKRDLKRYRRKGLRASTRLLVDALRPAAEGATLLDIGGGVGMIQHELMGDGLDRSTQVDASQEYLDASREEAERRGHADRTTYLFGDFVDRSTEVEQADIVTLDRVVCCYPDAETLIARSADKANQLYGLVYPRPRPSMRVVLALGNFFMWARRSAFRIFIYPPDDLDRWVRAVGFERCFDEQTFLWRVSVYRRAR